MINFKKEIAKQISKNVDISAEQIETYIEVPKDSSKGDYAFPCFRLAKELKKSPQIIAQEIEQKLQIDQKVMEKVEVVGAYINFYINKQTLAKEIIDGFQTEEIADEDGESDALRTEEVMLWGRRKKYHLRPKAILFPPSPKHHFLRPQSIAFSVNKNSTEHSHRLFSTKHSKAIPYRAFAFNSNRTSII